GQAGFFQEQGDLVAVGGGPVVELDHWVPPRRVPVSVGRSGAGTGRRDGPLRCSRGGSGFRGGQRAPPATRLPAPPMLPPLGSRPGPPLPCAVFSRSAAPHDAAPYAPPAQPALVPDLRLALAAAAAVPGPDPGAVRLRVPVRQGTLAPGPRRAEHGRAADHADRAGPDRRGDELQPAGDGDRRRLRNFRLAPGPGRPP